MPRDDAYTLDQIAIILGRTDIASLGMELRQKGWKITQRKIKGRIYRAYWYPPEGWTWERRDGEIVMKKRGFFARLWGHHAR